MSPIGPALIVHTQLCLLAEPIDKFKTLTHVMLAGLVAEEICSTLPKSTAIQCRAVNQLANPPGKCIVA